MDRYDNHMRVILHIGGKLTIYPALSDADMKEKGQYRKKATAAEIDATKESTTERQMAMGLILGLDQLRFG